MEPVNVGTLLRRRCYDNGRSFLSTLLKTTMPRLLRDEILTGSDVSAILGFTVEGVRWVLGPDVCWWSGPGVGGKQRDALSCPELNVDVRDTGLTKGKECWTWSPSGDGEGEQSDKFCLDEVEEVEETVPLVLSVDRVTAAVDLSLPGAVNQPPATTPHPASTLTQPPATTPHPASTLTQPPATTPHPASTLTQPPATTPHPASTLTQPPLAGHREWTETLPQQQTGAAAYGPATESGQDVATNMFIDVDENMFVGRESHIADIRRMLQRDSVVSISGIGGAGKTTTACLYAYSHWGLYPQGVLLVDASRATTLPIHFAGLAAKDTLNLLRNFDQDIKTSFKLVSKWLRTHSDYLLVFDAADDVSILEELLRQSESGDGYIPERSVLRGHVIITSRCPAECFQRLDVHATLMFEDMSTAEACTFLWRRVYYDDVVADPREEAAVAELVEKYISKLPLYLESTACHIRGKNITFQKYLKIVSSRPTRNPVDTPTFGDNRKTVDVSFTSNFEAVHEESVEASCLLDLASLCHSQNIPMALFSVGAFVLSLRTPQTQQEEEEGDVAALVEFLLSDMKGAEIPNSKVYKMASQLGEGAVRKLVQFPWRFHMVRVNRVGSEFSVHEVIQEQLRLRLEESGRMDAAVAVLATMLLHVLRADDVLLTVKRAFLSHAETCAAHMKTFATPAARHPRLYARLRMKTALAFASIGFFPTAWDILADVDGDMAAAEVGSQLIMTQVRAELFSSKARICVLQHRPREALSLGREGLEMADEGAGLEDPYVALEFAVLHRSCAHSYIAMHQADDEAVLQHMERARQTFETLAATTGLYCAGPYTNLLMLYGQLYRNMGVREPNGSHQFRSNYALALHWFGEAVTRMDPEGYMHDLCKIHIAITKLKLAHSTADDCVASLTECVPSLEKKLGRCHRYTAWVLEKIAIIQVDEGHVTEALEPINECLEILARVYGENDGKVQRGGTLLLKGKALLKVGRAAEARTALASALEMMRETPHNPGFTECQQLLDEAESRDVSQTSTT